MADQIESIEIRIDDGISANAGKMADGLNKVGAAADKVVENVRKVGPSLATVNKALDENAAYAAKSATANKRYEDQLAAVRAEESRGVITKDQLTEREKRAAILRDQAIAQAAKQRDALAAVFAGTTAVGTATDALATAQGRSVQSSAAASQGLSAMAAAMSKATQYQDALNRALGVTPRSNYADRAADIAAYGAEMDRLQAKYDPLFAATQKYEAALKEISQAQKVGAITAAQAGAAITNQKQILETSKAGLDQHAKASNGAAYEMRQFGIQGVQAVSGIATGQPILQTLIQQGHQVVDSFLAGGKGLSVFGDIAKSVGGFLVSVPGLLLATGAALVVMAVKAEGSADRLATLGQRLRATRADYEAVAASADAVATKVAASSTLSTSDARTSTNAIAGAAYFSGNRDELEKLVRLSADLARGFGEDIPTAAARLVQAINDPTAAAKRLLAEGFAPMNAGIVKQIELLEQRGHTQEAARIIEDKYAEGLKNSAAAQTDLQKAWTALQNSVMSGENGGKSLFEVIGKSVIDAAVEIIKGVKESIDQVTTLINKLKEFRDWLASKLPSFQGVGQTPVDQNTGKRAESSADLLRTQPEVNRRIYEIADANKALLGGEDVASRLADLATRVAYQESRGYQMDPKNPNRVLTSERGAMGLMQVMPDTARGIDPNLNPANIDDNILLGLRYLAQLSKMPAFKNEADVAGAYNAGPGAYGDYLLGKRNLPLETQKYIQQVAPGTTPSSQRSPYDMEVGVTAPRIGRGNYAKNINDALNDQVSTPYDDVAKLEANIDRYAKAIGDADKANRDANSTFKVGSKDMEELQRKLEAAKGAYNDYVGPTQAATRATNDQIPVFTAATGAAQTLAQAENEVRLAARKLGQEVSPIEVTNALKAAQNKLNAEFDHTIVQIEKNVVSLTAQNAAYAQGATSIIDATNRAKAEVEVRKTAKEGTELYTQEVDKLTKAYGQESAALAAKATFQQSITQNQELETLKLQSSLLGSSNEARDKELALLKEKQRIIQAGGSEAINTAESQASLRRVAQISDETAALKVQQNALDELGNFGTQTFQTIGTAITQAFATGSLKALDFKGLMKSVFSSIAQEVAKLAILNPIMNTLFGGDHRTTIADIGGVLGKLFGNSGGSSIGGNLTSDSGINAAAATIGTSTAAGVDYLYPNSVSGLSSTQLAAANNSSSKGSLLDGAGTAGTLLKGADWLSGGKLLSTVKDAFGIGSSGTFAESVSSFLGETTTNVAGSAAAGSGGAFGGAVGESAALAGETTAGAVEAAATVAESANAAVGAIGSAVSAISSALPYIGTAITVVTDLINGNFRGAAFVLAGAAIGTLILPGIGTAVGAAVGGLVDTFFPQHAKNPYEFVDLNVKDGKLEAGKAVAQLSNPAELKSGVENYAAAINKYLDAVHLMITNPDSRVGIIGSDPNQKDEKKKPMASPAEAFKALRFGPDGTVNPESNLYKAEQGGLAGQQFEDPQVLQTELLRIAGFADGLDVLGIKLKQVGSKLTDIQIASVELGGDGPDGKKSDFRTALQNDLTSQHFSDVDALTAEINKVNQFVNGTMPSLLNPVFETTSSLVKQIGDLSKQYADARYQAQLYGLATDDLTKAQAKAIAMLQEPAIKAFAQYNNGIQLRGAQARGESTAYYENTQFDQNADNQREALKKQITDIFGSVIPVAEQYAADLATLNATIDAERLVMLKKRANAEAAATQQAAAALQQAADAQDTIRARISSAGGDQLTADLINSDIKARQERAGFASSYATAADYGAKLAALDQAQGAERLAIVKRYADAQTQTAIKTAQDAATAAAATIRAGLPGGPVATSGTAARASLTVFDQTAAELRRSYSDAMIGALGRGKAFADQMVAYDRDLAGQRLAIEQQFGADLLAAQQAAANANISLQVRALTALGDATGSAALQADQQNKANREQLVAQGADTKLFDLTVALEKASTGQKAATTSLNDALTKQTNALNSQLSSLRQNTDTLKTAADSLRKYSLSLNTSAASPLSPTEQLKAATKAMADDLRIVTDTTKDQSTRANAGQQLQADAQTRLGISEGYYGKATGGYAGDFSKVQADLDIAATSLSNSQSVGERSLLILQAQLQLTQAYSDQSAAIGTAQYDTATKSVDVAKSHLSQAIALAHDGNKTADTNAQEQLKTTLDAADTQRAAILAGNAVITADNGDILSVDKLGNLILQATSDQLLAATNAGNGQALSIGNAQIDGINLLAAAVSNAADGQRALQDQLRAQLAAAQAQSAQAAAQAKAQADAKAASDAAAANKLLAEQQAASDAARAAAADARVFADQQVLAAKQANAIWQYFTQHTGAPNLAPDSGPPTAEQASGIGYQGSRYGAGLNLQSAYLGKLGREASLQEINAILDNSDAGVPGSDVGSIIAYLGQSAEAKAYQKRLTGMVNGGSVSNGVFNQDSVIAAYAGGGNIMLAGGEYVVNARQAAQYGSILPSINAGRYQATAANDDSSASALRAIRAELQALRQQMDRQTRVTADGAVQVRDAVREGNGIEQKKLSAVKMKAS